MCATRTLPPPPTASSPPPFTRQSAAALRRCAFDDSSAAGTLSTRDQMGQRGSGSVSAETLVVTGFFNAEDAEDAEVRRGGVRSALPAAGGSLSLPQIRRQG